MTQAAEASGPSARRRTWLWVALALSLTLNLFVAGGLLWSSMRPPQPPGPAERFIGAARQLDLNPDQRDALRKFAVQARELNQQLRAANAPLMRQIWEEVAKPQPDNAAVSRLTDQALENRRDFQGKMSTNLMIFVATLTPDQPKRFAENVTRRPGARADRGPANR